MPSILKPFGILILTYWVSRACLKALRPLGLDLIPTLVIGHTVSFAICATFVMTVGVGDMFAALPYLAVQVFWFGVDWARARLNFGGSKRRRRRSRQSSSMAKGTYRAPNSLSVPKWLIPAVMTAVTAGYASFGWNLFAYDAISYHDIIVGTSPQETIYAAGKPAYGRNSDSEPWRKVDDPLKYSQWQYRQPLMTVRFTPNKVVQDIRCTNDDKLSQSSCPGTLAISIGNSEGQLYKALGVAPAGGTTQDGKRIASYPELGHNFVLEQFYVRSLQVGPSNGNTLAKLWRFFLWLVP